MRAVSEPEGPTDELLHDLVRACPDLGDPSVHPRPGHSVVAHVSIPAVQLNASIQDLILDFGTPPLRFRGVDRRQFASCMGVDACIHERLCDIDTGSEVGDDELVVLEAANGLPEGSALQSIFDGFLQDL